MSLRSGLDEILKVCSEEKVTEVHKLAVVLVFNVDHAPPVLTTSNLLAIDNDRLFRTNNGEWNHALNNLVSLQLHVFILCVANLNMFIQGSLLVIKLFIIVWEHFEVVECELLLDALLESQTLLHG